jgi:hypothetical protein
MILAIVYMIMKMKRNDYLHGIICLRNKKYSLANNKWLDEIVDVKEKLAIVYGQHMFTIDKKRT